MSHKNDPGLDAWVGMSLRVRRVAAGLTLKQFANKVGVTSATVARWETDDNAPTAQSVERIAEELQSKPQDFSRPPVIV